VNHGELRERARRYVSARKSERRGGIVDLGRRRCWGSSVAALVELVRPERLYAITRNHLQHVIKAARELIDRRIPHHAP